MKKICWLAKQYKRGWKVGLADNNKTTWLPLLFIDEKSISKTLKTLGIVFVHMKGE